MPKSPTFQAFPTVRACNQVTLCGPSEMYNTAAVCRRAVHGPGAKRKGMSCWSDPELYSPKLETEARAPHSICVATGAHARPYPLPPRRNLNVRWLTTAKGPTSNQAPTSERWAKDHHRYHLSI